MEKFGFFLKRSKELKNNNEDRISPNPYSELYQRGMQNKPKIEK